jgi:hypothetical protein
MINKWRALLGFGVVASSLGLAGVLYQGFPVTAGAVRRLAVSAALIMPLYMVGLLILDSSFGIVGTRSTRRLLLGGAMTGLSGVLGATSLLDYTPSPVQEVAFMVTFFLLLFGIIRSLRNDRHSLNSDDSRAR